MKLVVQIISLLSLWSSWAEAGDCYWRGLPWCGLMFSCGSDHFMTYGVKFPCVISLDKYCCPAGDHDDIILCEDKDLGGHCISQTVEKKKCVTVEKNDWASSADVLGKCFRLYENDKCEGKSRAIYPDGPGLKNFQDIELNDMVSSISLCSEADTCNISPRSKRSDGNHNCRWFTDMVTIGFLVWLRRDQDNLRPPIRYYQTGRLNDRTEVMEAFIEQHHLNTGTNTNPAARKYARRMGRQNDQAGHILARRLGGSGTDLRNIFPQNANFNTGVWAQIEGIVANVVENYDSALFTVNLYYETDEDTRPTRIIYRIIRGDTNQVVHFDDLLNP